MFQDQSNVLLQNLLILVLGQQQDVEAGMGCRQVECIGMALNQKLQ